MSDGIYCVLIVLVGDLQRDPLSVLVPEYM